eukprot:c4521_g1_i2.p1 GENE.c4521_g1_i2~~c4521_g1_i2.p1  ORF type:complete len:246 (+),score=61.83 c4521_g1_i2:23-739(+)
MADPTHTTEVEVPAGLAESLKQLDSLRKEVDQTTSKIKKIHQKMDGLSESSKLDSWARLRTLYSEAIVLSEREESLALHCSDLVESVIEDWESSHTGSKKRKRSEHTQAQKKAGIVPNDEEVACRHEGQWILGKIKSHNPKKNEYKIQDADETNAHAIFSVPVSDVLQLIAPEFSKGTRVLALYPNTTCFYPAEVVSFTKRGSKPHTYRLQFDDDFEDGREKQTRIEQKYVVEDPTPS